MLAYYLPTILTSEAVTLSSTPSSKEYVEIDTEDLAVYGFKKAFLDGVPVAFPGKEPVRSNELYFQLYRNTTQKKWLEKIDKGRLYVPIILEQTDNNSPPRKLYRRVGNGAYAIAFLSPKDFQEFDEKKRFANYRLVHSDRTETYSVNGILI